MQGTGAVTTLQEFTGSAGLILHPTWNNSGNKIAFLMKLPSATCTLDVDCNWNIYTINPDGTGLTALTNDLHHVVPAGTLSFNGTATGLTQDTWVVASMQVHRQLGWTNVGAYQEAPYLTNVTGIEPRPFSVIEYNPTHTTPGTRIDYQGDNCTPGAATSWCWDSVANKIRVHPSVVTAQVRAVEKVNDIHRVAADGSSAGKDKTLLVKMTKTSAGVSGPQDPAWNSCGLIASSAGNLVRFENPHLTESTGTNVAHLLRTSETTSASDVLELIFQPKWNPTNCDLISFIAWDTGVTRGNAVTSSPTDVWIAQDKGCGGGSGWSQTFNRGWQIPTVLGTDNTCVDFQRVTSNGGSGPHYFVDWMADGRNLVYSRNEGPTVLFIGDQGQTNTDVEALFNGARFQHYMEYVWTGAAFADGAFAIPPQNVGNYTTEGGIVTGNSYGLAQCKGASCPGGDRPFVFVNNTIGFPTSGPVSAAQLQTFSLADSANVTANGGLLFLNGRIQAVFPKGSWDLGANSPVKLVTQAEYATLPNLSGVAGADDDGARLVFTGIARNLGPHGSKFNTNIQLVFNYCDTDGDGLLDVAQDAICSDPTDSSIDARKMFVYYFDDTSNTWKRYGGVVDIVARTITIETDHFSTYAAWGGRRGSLAPGSFVVLEIGNLHTYPNPFQHSAGGSITFNADTFKANGNVTVKLKVYDIRGKEVGMAQGLSNPIADVDVNGGFKLLNWPGTDRSGRPLPSGVYLYRMEVMDVTTGFRQNIQGKLSIVR